MIKSISPIRLIRPIGPIKVVVLLLLLVIAGCSSGEETRRVYKKRPVPVKMAVVQRGAWSRTLHYKGTVHPWRKARIGPDVSGRVKTIYKKPGDPVQKNQLLAVLDVTTLELQVKQAEAARDTARASFNDAQLNHRRIDKLYQKKAVSQLQFEKSRLALEAAVTRRKTAEAAFKVTAHALENAHMRAPFAGVITSRNLEEGDFINPMMGMNTGVLTLMDLSKVKVAVDVPAEEIESIAAGQPCVVHVSSRPGETFRGAVYSKNLAADPVSKTFKVEVAVENPGIKIKAGVFADVAVETDRVENALLLPVSALIQRRGITYVVLEKNGRSKFQTVTVGRKNETFCQVLEGLREGQSVVVEGNYDLKENSLITISGDQP